MLFRALLAYDGTHFHGWQRQPGGARTVQGTLEAALAKLAGGRRVVVHGAGRTDAGVHAAGQVASFELARPMGAGDVQRALNALLPTDVRVLDLSEAPAGFHARRSASSKLYRYVLDTGAVQPPERRLYAGHVLQALDREAVAEAAELFVGRRDFAALASAGSAVKTTIRAVTRAAVSWDEPAPGLATLTFEAEADGFLRRMVRSMVGGLIAAGKGDTTAAKLRRALEAGDRSLWPAPAPARGLVLVRVDYGAVIR